MRFQPLDTIIADLTIESIATVISMRKKSTDHKGAMGSVDRTCA